MKQLETDVVVVAAGTAGLPAAVTAAQGGAKVIIFEKRDRTGGTPGGGQIIAVESGPQRRQGITLPKKELFKAHMDYVHWRADARLVKAFYDQSGATIDWFEKMGLEFSVMKNGPGPYPVTHRSAGTPFARVDLLTNKAKELGIQIILKTPAKQLIKEGNRITGVIAEEIDGEEVRVKSKAVVVATGGFGDNPEMIKKYTGFEKGRDFFGFKIPGLTGDGIRMAWEVGAAQSEMSMQLIFGLPEYVGASGATPELQSFIQPNLMVNLMGERFMDEENLKDTTFVGNNIARQKGRCGFMIFDEDIKKYYVESGVDIQFPGPPGEDRRATKLDGEMKKALDKGYQHLFIADTIEELCEKTGIDLDGLKKTINEYNTCCANGCDNVFEKNAKYLRPIKTPKFYAGRFFPSAYGSLGGIRINYKTEVLNQEYRVIPGLYAAGVDAASIYGDSYTRFLYGNTLGFCSTSGRMAGASALEYVKTI